MNKYKLTYDNGSTEITHSAMDESKIKAHYLPNDGSYVTNCKRMIVAVESVK